MSRRERLAACGAMIGFLAVFNVATWLRLGIDRPVADGEPFGQILVDIAVFTALLYLAGGADIPFAYMSGSWKRWWKTAGSCGRRRR